MAQEVDQADQSDAGRRRPVLVLAVVAVVAVVLAGYFAWLTIFRPAAKADAPVTTTTVVNRAGGYTLQVPVGMTSTRRGKTTSLLDAGRSLSVTVTTSAVGRPRSTNDAVVTAMRSTYASVAVLATKNRTVDHRPALATYGAVVSKAGQKVQFVLVTVRGKAKNFSLSTFAPVDSQGDSKGSSTVQRRFDAVVSGFRIGTTTAQ